MKNEQALNLVDHRAAAAGQVAKGTGKYMWSQAKTGVKPGSRVGGKHPITNNHVVTPPNLPV